LRRSRPATSATATATTITTAQFFVHVEFKTAPDGSVTPAE
jgi:hypothetical protein